MHSVRFFTLVFCCSNLKFQLGARILHGTMIRVFEKDPFPENSSEVFDFENRTPPIFTSASILDATRYEQETLFGRKILLTCLVSGFPLPEVTWYKQKVQVYAHNYFQVRDLEVAETLMQSQLQISPSTRMDSGNYECLATNQLGTDSKIFSIRDNQNLVPRL